jgi:hypothetical protein
MEMSDVCKYFQFLSNTASIELLNCAKTGIMGPENVPQLTRKQYYDKTQKARKLGLIFKKSGGYYLTSFGEMLIERVKIISELKTTEWMFKSIDAQTDDEVRLQLIHQMFNKDPEIESVLTGNSKSTRPESPSPKSALDVV